MIPDTPSSRPGTYRRPCPECGKGARDDALAVTRKHDASLVWYCHRCGYSGKWWPDEGGKPVSRRHRAAIEASAPDRTTGNETEHATLSDYWRAFWRECQPIEPGTVAERYLTVRCCALPHPNGDLRFHPNASHPGGHTGPVLVGLVTDMATGEPINLHRTWIVPNGTKPDIERPRMLCKGHRKAGGVIRLWPDDEVTDGLAVAEGIETALTAAHGITPVWCLIDAGNLAAFPVLPGVGALTVCVDHDKPDRQGRQRGLTAAAEVSNRWTLADREVRRWVPPVTGDDVNDMYRGAAHG